MQQSHDKGVWNPVGYVDKLTDSTNYIPEWYDFEFLTKTITDVRPVKKYNNTSVVDNTSIIKRSVTIIKHVFEYSVSVNKKIYQSEQFWKYDGSILQINTNDNN